jgi:hypothetical protein
VLELFMTNSDGFFSIDEVIKSYVAWLEVKAPEHRAAYVRRLRDEREGAQAEAITFALLRVKRRNPTPAGVVGIGGVDFLCKPDGRPEFVVEVTALSRDVVTAKSGLAGPQSENRVGSFSMITTTLMREAVNKATQMANYPMARVLVLASSHPDASLLMSARAAEELLTGTTVISMRLGDVTAKPELVAKLQNSVFFRMGARGDVEPARQSISAILLMNITESGASLLGPLHPAPAHAFDTGTFDTVHFVRLREWPITDRFGIEWVGPVPAPTFVPHWPVTFEDRELR